MELEANRLCELFRQHFGSAPVAGARAPGRVNVIGEHTDYNHGFVLPMAIERETRMLARPREDNRLRVYAVNLEREGEIGLDSIARNREEPWLDYISGVTLELHRQGLPAKGADILIAGDVPIGAGLSSSASLEMAALALFETLGGFELSGLDAASLGQRVENHFLGVHSGIMDQFAVRLGKASHALFLDCRTLEHRPVSVAFPDARFVIANTNVSRGLSGSKYNERVAECAEAVRVMSEKTGAAGTHLRDFNMETLEASRTAMPEHVYRRARHVMSENTRTRRACEALQGGFPAALGLLMNESDESLRRDYEVTCPELDAMTAIARSLDGCFGARMTGAGFGGCTINLVASETIPAFESALMQAYSEVVGLQGAVIDSAPADGAGPLRLPH